MNDEKSHRIKLYSFVMGSILHRTTEDITHDQYLRIRKILNENKKLLEIK